MTEKKWFVLQVISGKEAKTKKNLDEGRSAAGMLETIEEVIVPSERVVEVKRGQQKVSDRRLWPGYVLIKMQFNDDSWFFVKQTNGVIGFLGGDKPVPLSDQEVEKILHELKDKEGSVGYKNKVQVGDFVKIVDGVFENFLGTVEEVNQERGKLSVMVSIFGRDTRVDDLEFWQVEEASHGENGE